MLFGQGQEKSSNEGLIMSAVRGSGRSYHVHWQRVCGGAMMASAIASSAAFFLHAVVARAVSSVRSPRHVPYSIVRHCLRV
jgi:hypothetical protein